MLFYFFKGVKMAQANSNQGKVTPKDNSANMQNPNKGTSGTNRQFSSHS